MDTWLVTRKPVGLIEGKTPEEHVSPRLCGSLPSFRFLALCITFNNVLTTNPLLTLGFSICLLLPHVQTFIFKSHILAGQPTLASSSPYSEYAWLTKPEIQRVMMGSAETEWVQVEPLLS